MPSYAEERRTFFYNLKRYGLKITKIELRQSIITILIIAFVWSFGKFGNSPKTFLLDGVKNFLLGALYAALALIANQIGQRFVAVHYGYDPVYEYGMLGLMIAMVIAFASRGFLIFFLPGVINLRHLAASRLGEFRYYTNDWEWAKAAQLGPVLNIMFAIVLSLFKHIPFVRELMIMNIMFAFYSLIPLPGNLGLPLFYPHIYFWTFTFGFVFACSAAMFFLNPLLTLIIGLAFAVFAMYWHYAVKDQRL